MMQQIYWHQQIGFPILTLLILLPVVGAIRIWFMKDSKGARIEATVISLFQFALGLVVLAFFASGVSAMQFVEKISWIPVMGISYHVGIDGISLFLVLLTTLITLLTVLYSWDRIQHNFHRYVACLLVLEAGMIGAFVSLDLVLFFVFWEIMLVPMYFLIKIWGLGPDKENAALKYVVYNLTGSVLMLVGFIILFLNYHYWAFGRIGSIPYSFGYLDLLRAEIPLEAQYWIFALVFLGFAVKGPIFPFHTWLPSAMTNGPIAVGVMLSGVKLGSYGLLRFNLPLAPDASQAAVPIMMTLALAGLIYGAFIAISHPNIMTMMAYAGISHLGFVTLGLFALNQVGIEGALIQMVNLGIAGAGMMFVAAFLADRGGSFQVAAYGGLASRAPVFATLALIIVLASLAMPGTNVFVGEFLILVGAFQAHWIYATIGVIAVILAAAYLLWMYERVMLGKLEKPELGQFPDLNKREGIIAVVTVALILWIGFYPAPVLKRMEPSVRAVVDRFKTERVIVEIDPNNPHAYLLDLLEEP